MLELNKLNERLLNLSNQKSNKYKEYREYNSKVNQISYKVEMLMNEIHRLEVLLTDIANAKKNIKKKKFISLIISLCVPVVLIVVLLGLKELTSISQVISSLLVGGLLGTMFYFTSTLNDKGFIKSHNEGSINHELNDKKNKKEQQLTFQRAWEARKDEAYLEYVGLVGKMHEFEEEITILESEDLIDYLLDESNVMELTNL